MADLKRDRLTTWAEIADYIGRDARTAKRYEAERGLPVHRMPGEGKSTVFAFAPELDAWLRRSDERAPPTSSAPAAAPASPPSATPPDRAEAAPARGRRLPWRALLAASIALLTAGWVLAARTWSENQAHSSVAAGAPPSYQAGVYAWSRRTPEGIRSAIDDFTQAIVQNPRFAPAFVGLADCYNLAPEFAGMSPDEAYPRAKAAAERAIALDPNLAPAHRALAFVDFWWAGEQQRGVDEFRTALRLDPRSAQTHHWFANALAARGDPGAIAEYNKTLALESTTPAMADKGWGLLMLGRYAEAKAVLDEVVRLDPNYASAHGYLAQLAEARGDDRAMLEEQRRVAELTHDTEGLKADKAAALALDRGGHLGMLETIAEQRRKRAAADPGAAWSAAAVMSELHRRDETLALLERAKAAHHPAIQSLDHLPTFAWLRHDPRMRRLLADRP